MRRTPGPAWLVALTACATAQQVETQAPLPNEGACEVEVVNETEYVLQIRGAVNQRLGEVRPHESLTFGQPCERGSVRVSAYVRVSPRSPLRVIGGSAELVRGGQARIVLRW